MVAVCRSLWLVLVAVIPLVACSQTAPEPRIDSGSLSQLLSKRLAGSVAELRSDIERCGSAEKESGAIILTPALLQSASREQLLVGLGHLHFHNRFECERQARLAAAFDVGTMQSLASSEVSPDDLQVIKRSLIYPSKQQLEYELRYLELPGAVRSSLEATIGTEPFMLMETLEVNNLTAAGP